MIGRRPSRGSRRPARSGPPSPTTSRSGTTLEPIGRDDRALRGGSESSNRLDRVADEFEARGQVVAGREDVDDAAADAELAVLVDRVFARESRVDERSGEAMRVDVVARAQVEHEVEEGVGRAHARSERRGRRHDDAGVAGRHGVQRPRARRRDAEVRGEAAVGIDFLRREGHDALLERRLDAPSRPPRKNRVSVVSCSTSRSVGTTTRTTSLRGSSEAAPAIQRALAAGVRPPGHAALRLGAKPARTRVVRSSSCSLRDGNALSVYPSGAGLL